jgi:hypothetical protein
MMLAAATGYAHPHVLILDGSIVDGYDGAVLRGVAGWIEDGKFISSEDAIRRDANNRN